jgi:multidrug efflux pump
MTVYLITLFISLAGIMAYNSLPKESFPDITVPKFFKYHYMVVTHQVISKTLLQNQSKKIKIYSWRKKINSNSMQDVSLITVEFHTNVKVEVDKAKSVKDKVDEARADLPATLTSQPMIKEISVF